MSAAQAIVRTLVAVWGIVAATAAACWLIDITVGWWRR